MPATTDSLGLLTAASEGFPDAYVAARLVPRLSGLRQSQRSPRENLQSAWSASRDATRWLYMQLSHAVRRELLEIFYFLELPSLTTACRLLAAGHRSGASSSLRESLWGAPVRRVLAAAQDSAKFGEQLYELFGEHDWPIPPVEQTETRHPQQHFEEQLHLGLYQRMQRKHGWTGSVLLSACCDLHNLARCRTVTRWPARFELLPGGNLTGRDFRSPEHLHAAIAHGYGHHTPTGDLEYDLKHALTRRLLAEARSGPLLPRAAAYLWGHHAMLHPLPNLRGGPSR